MVETAIDSKGREGSAIRLMITSGSSRWRTLRQQSRVVCTKDSKHPKKQEHRDTAQKRGPKTVYHHHTYIKINRQTATGTAMWSTAPRSWVTHTRRRSVDECLLNRPFSNVLCALALFLSTHQHNSTINNTSHLIINDSVRFSLDARCSYKS